MEISSTKKEEIISKVQKVLFDTFEGPKREMRIYLDRLNFACPYCGDSNDPYKKRGNLYWKNLIFHCYNGGCSKRHTNLVEFLKDHNQSINTKDDLIFYLDYIRMNQTIVQTKSYMELGVFEKMNEYSIPISDIKEKFSLLEPKENLRIERYLKGRFLHGKLDFFLYDPKEEQLYIFNLTPDLKRTYGWQIRNFKQNRTKYISYNIEKANLLIYDKRIEASDEELVKMNTLSIYFNISLVDFTKTVTIFEGPIDSFLLKNSIGISGVDKPIEMFDEISTVRYLFDNDKAGRIKMEKQLKKRKSVFMWNKLVRDFKIRENVKDFNDLLGYCWKYKNNAIRELEKYFTENPLDIRSV
jgi:hypothetical protein